MRDMHRLLSLALLGALAAISPAANPAFAADTACRPTTLGSQRCSGGPIRPEPRPVIRSDTQALERVTDKAGKPANSTVFVPAGQRGRLGTTIIDAPGPIGTCRTDTLGNVRCR
jgi:hypothetical protein